jgi:prevent-host-death family protein
MPDAIISLSEFKSDASRLLARMREEPGVLVLTQNGRASAVVQDYEQYQAEREGLLMLKLLVQGEVDVAQGRTIPQAEVFARLRQELSGPGAGGAK